MNIGVLVKVFLTLCVLFSVETAFAQMQIPKDTSGKIYQKEEVDKSVDYKGGIQDFPMLFVTRAKWDLPETCQFNFVLQFIVETSGEITDLKVINIEVVGLEEADIEKNTKEAIHTLGNLKDWIPAIKDGKIVRCVFEIPFTLFTDMEN
ncbi:MAG: energy transducer TonB [Flavobacteriaceae bacterium]|jgi:hypothetical protein|nr:energy transducer TonB [Flavobacteriaceae bacterium]